ncbi:methyltransferase domain-containing protein [Winogradskyella sp.]|uniref:methyltransferase domain-containing protein n=1 Tax=Winogradskyella sp. TaxID=1883156 RepID=UPI0025EE5028|nr:methyltransferase domain-containing protein [Winogradskyella sp.]
MKKNNLDIAYWENRYTIEQIGWNIGYPSTPIKAYIDQLEDKTLKILIPGAGNSYEAEYLWENGFKNVYVLDFAKQPLDNLKHRVENFPEVQLLHSDFFELNDSFDLILEQTFFCALSPIHRKDYVKKMCQLLKPNGRLVGLLFDFKLTESGPPYGGSLSEYTSLFKEFFKIKTLENSINSIKERQGKELFFIFESL